MANNSSMLAVLDTPEILGIMVIIVTLYGAKHWPTIMRGLRAGRRSFDEAASDAGESIAGIYGKPAAEALTPDNHTAELYDPAAFRRDEESKPPRPFWLNRIWSRFVRFFHRLSC